MTETEVMPVFIALMVGLAAVVVTTVWLVMRRESRRRDAGTRARAADVADPGDDRFLYCVPDPGEAGALVVRSQDDEVVARIRIERARAPLMKSLEIGERRYHCVRVKGFLQDRGVLRAADADEDLAEHVPGVMEDSFTPAGGAALSIRLADRQPELTWPVRSEGRAIGTFRNLRATLGLGAGRLALPESVPLELRVFVLASVDRYTRGS